MEPSLFSSGQQLGAGLAASLALAWALGRGGTAWLERARGRRYVARGQRGEVRARRLLRAAGYRVLQAQPRREVTLRVNGEERSYQLCPDFLCRRWGRLYVADAKTGAGADPLHPATRRQLLEYACAFAAGGALVVDVAGERVLRLDLQGLPRREGRSSVPGLLLCALGLLCAVPCLARLLAAAR